MFDSSWSSIVDAIDDASSVMAGVTDLLAGLAIMANESTVSLSEPMEILVSDLNRAHESLATARNLLDDEEVKARLM